MKQKDLEDLLRVTIRQTYLRVSKRALRLAGSYGRRRKRSQMLQQPACREGLERKLPLLRQLHGQQQTDKNKVYSLCMPETECLSKGKAHKPYEYGAKMSQVTSNKNGWVLAVRVLHGRPYDGHTLVESVELAEWITDVRVLHAYADLGYRGAKLENAQIHWPSDRNPTRGERKRMRRRSCIEATIGFMKAKGKLDRNRLRGK